MSLQLDGNPIRSIRRDIIQGGTVRILKLLRDRFSQEEHGDEAKSTAPIIGTENNAFPDRFVLFVCSCKKFNELIWNLSENKRFQMRKARSLAISGKNLKDIPDSVFMTAQEESVDKIDLSKNKLAKFPDGWVLIEKQNADNLLIIFSFFFWFLFFLDFPIWNHFCQRLI